MEEDCGKIFSANNIKPALEGRCGFFLKRKQRFCKMIPASGNVYCAEHSVSNGESGLNSAQKRILCPLNPKHTVFAERLDQHLKKCNARVKLQMPYIDEGINSGIKDYLFSHEEQSALCDVPEEELKSLISRLRKCCSEISERMAERLSLHAVLEKELNAPENGANARKHLIQQASLIKILDEENLLRAGTIFIEFGAGRGKLSHWIQKALIDSSNTSFLLVDRSNNRKKFDCFHKRPDQGPSFERLFVDIEHLNLAKVESVAKSDAPIVAVGKHLCGAATDFSFRCLIEPSTCQDLNITCEVRSKKARCGELWDRVDAFLFALCCYHRCSWPTYVGREFMAAQGFSPVDFHRMTKMASWNTCAFHRRKDEASGDEQVPVANEKKHGPLGLSAAEQEDIGRLCKRVIDAGRLDYVRQRGFTASALKYVALEVTLENVAILVQRKPSL